MLCACAACWAPLGPCLHALLGLNMQRPWRMVLLVPHRMLEAAAFAWNVFFASFTSLSSNGKIAGSSALTGYNVNPIIAKTANKAAGRAILSSGLICPNSCCYPCTLKAASCSIILLLLHSLS